MKATSRINNRGIDILVVEDSPTQAEELIYTLMQNHYFVRKASNGKQAISLIEQQKPLVVISDIMMPEMNGYELCRYIKENENLRYIPVILLTSLSDPKDIINGLESGADNFIMKPFDENYLLSRIDYVVANQDLQRKERLELGVEIFFGGKRYFINSQKRQILDLLMSTYETAVKKNEELQRAQIELRKLNDELENKVEERTALLTHEIAVRKQAEEEIKILNIDLEKRVLERTAQLELTNKELETFSYSVSHDLRAPLRSIDGFSLALLQNYSDKLDDKGKKYLQFVWNSAVKMNELIEDLIGLSHVSRVDLRCSTVDLSLIANNIISELQKDEPGRIIEFITGQGLFADCDYNLITIVLENLFRNASKYSSKKPNTRIEFNTIQNEGEKLIYFIRDNGAGFDMKYADKLFGPFQRLHSESEFPGTGIGLATVKRIINRHGGNIWAEAEIDNGATFYFTL